MARMNLYPETNYDNLSTDDYLVLDGDANGTRRILAKEFNPFNPVDSGLNNSGSPADAKVAGDALYLNKSKTDNSPIGFTFWKRTGFNDTNPASPLDMPPNSLTYAKGSVLAGFTCIKSSDYAKYYWVVCAAFGTYANSFATRTYFVWDRGGINFYIGRANLDTSTTVYWRDRSYFALDDTLSNLGSAADAKVVGDALYHASKSNSIETKCPLKYVSWSDMRSTVNTIVNMAPNTCVLTESIGTTEQRDSLNSFLGEAFVSKYGNTAIKTGTYYIISKTTLYHNEDWTSTFDLYSVISAKNSALNRWSAYASNTNIVWDDFTPSTMLPRIIGNFTNIAKANLENDSDIRYKVSTVANLNTYFNITKPQEMLDGSYVTMNGSDMAQFLNGNLPSSDLETADTYWTLKKIKASNSIVQFQLISIHGTYIYLGALASSSPNSISWSENLVNKWTRYDITYNIESSPSITTDVNNFLPAIISSYDSQTGKPIYSTADRASDIASMLSQTGCCILGPGVFYVSGVELPEGTSIRGQGNATKVIWKNTGTSCNYVFKLNTDCTISDLKILGGSGSAIYTPSENIGAVSGILVEGIFVALEDTQGPRRCRLNNLYIGYKFGCGIKMQHTGTGIDSNVKMVNCTIQNCDCGIYNGTFSEFNMFTNIGCNRNYYGVISKGGNNRFVNCDFSANEIGAYLDCTNEPNNSHGMFSACEFAHNGRVVFEKNKGYSIVCKGVTNGERFDGCTIGYGSIDISDSTTVKFCNCGIGRQQRAIRLSDTNNIQFNGCSFGEGTTISVPEGKTNTNMHIINCFYSDGTPFVVE